ncbi:MAG: carbohydrate ABC transporter permease [Pleurocapsa minor GSE-CHR-MK-17-07R]|jgi:putative chitobiose transport system permease protein|nr:carbohydrate ABC transporter permease [Pleurocapsa minor GSE-CHR-MK 17-07R]
MNLSSPKTADIALAAPPRVRKPRGRWLGKTGWYTIMVLFGLVTAVPFLWTALMSVRPNSANVFRANQPPEIIPYPGLIGWGEGQRTATQEGSYTALPWDGTLPEGTGLGWWRDYGDQNELLLGTTLSQYAFPATTANYYRVWTDVNLPRYIFNSLVVAFSVVTLQLLTCSLAAYPLAKMRFKGRDTAFYLILATLVFPDQLTLIPTFIMSVNIFGFADTLHGLIIPFGANAFGIFLLRQTYQSIPNEIMESARIDGASEFGIWWRILLPLIRPGLATLAIFSFVGSWNSFLWPLLMLRNEAMFTLPVGLAFLEGAFTGNLRTVAAGVMVATVPIILLFLVFQRQFIRGLSGAVKG